MKLSRTSTTLAAVALASGLALSACSSDDASDAVSGATSSAESAASEASSAVSSATESVTAPESGTEGTEGAVITGPDGPLDGVDPAITAKYTELGGASSTLGDATGPQSPVGDGFSVPFEGGTIFTSPETGAHVVQGEILRVYTEQGGPSGALGFPENDETTVPGGWSSTFTGGTVTWTDASGDFAETIQLN